MLEKVIEEHPEVQIGNFNGDNAYLSDKNSDALDEHEIINNIAPRKTSSRKISKKQQNQRKCIEGIFGIIVQCLGLQKTWVRGLPNVFKDTSLKFIAFFFLMIVAHEAGVEEMYLTPTYFFG
ncbi:hypothetical protein LCGC14_1587370 [marine sediment metagenome]|uniref:Transposase IS4-like domain-containing protein n=1 Tax=marine sediment metagenome TaxID=412755 RepID=A0A0F9KVN2_9ZZZZ